MRLSPPAWTAFRLEQRRLLQDAVLGKTFTPAALADLSSLPESELEPLLAGVVRKEVLGTAVGSALTRARPIRLPAGPRPPRRLPDPLQARTQDTASGRRGAPAERVRRRRRGGGDPSPPTIWPRPPRPPPQADDAEAIRAQAGGMLARAGERAGLHSAPPTRDSATTTRRRSWPTMPPQRADAARPRGRHGRLRAGEPDGARTLLEEAIDTVRGARATRTPPRASSGRLGRARCCSRARRDEAVARLERALRGHLRPTSPTRISRMLAAQLSRAALVQRRPRACRRAGGARARHRRGAARYPEALALALRAKGAVAFSRGHAQEALRPD